MMILHTSDWHVGKTMRGRSRAHEHEAVLAEIAQIARDEQVDLILVAGDMFETASPTPESERIVYRALLDLASTGAQVALVAGNHDNERRLAAVEPLLGLGSVVARSHLALSDDGGVVTIETGKGERARLGLLPFPSQRYIVKAQQLMSMEGFEHAGSYASRVRMQIEELCTGFRPDTVNILCAHLTVAGGAFGGGERQAQSVFDYLVPAPSFPASIQYAALGHLHRVQRIPGPCPLWYSGSPLQLDFGETKDQKCVLVADVAPGAPAQVREVPLRSGRRLRVLRGTIEDLRALEGTTGDDYLRVHVQGERRAGVAEEIRERFPEAVDVIAETPERERAAERTARAGRSPHELFAEYLAERSATDERVLALFDRLLDEAHGEEAHATAAP